ncbi:hypothetical protein [Streptomyces sp. NBC_00459]|uniref:hypothetical protein n=1 Tax=Streptomyces sp. NBC_00459 TaxID=2975749 RepID=UPI002E19AE15
MATLLDSPEPRRVSPGEYPVWDRALALLNRDLAVTLPAQEPLRLLALTPCDANEPENVYVTLADDEWHGNCLDPDCADDPAAALAEVADAAQETIMDRMWQAWPVCADHGLGMHPRGADGQLADEEPYWWCAGEASGLVPAHVRAAVGALDTLVTRT